MPIGKLTIELSIPHAHSLKDRRQVVRSMKDKLRQTFNLAVCEMNDGTLWNQATIEIAVISSSTQLVAQHLASIDRHAHRLAAGLSAEIADSYAELLTEQSDALDVSAPGDDSLGLEPDPSEPAV